MKKLVPILPSKNIPESLEFYQRIYGFKNAWAWTKAGQQVKDFSSVDPKEIVYGGLDEPHLVHFWFSDVKHILESAGMRIEVEDINTIYATCQAANCVHPNAPLETKPDFPHPLGGSERIWSMWERKSNRKSSKVDFER